MDYLFTILNEKLSHHKESTNNRFKILLQRINNLEFELELLKNNKNNIM